MIHISVGKTSKKVWLILIASFLWIGLCQTSMAAESSGGQNNAEQRMYKNEVKHEASWKKAKNKAAGKNLVGYINPDWAKHLEISGALRFNYRFEDWSESNRKDLGNIKLDALYFNIKANKDNFLLDASYWFYNHERVLEHGWFGYQFNKSSKIEFGAPFQPFGIMPYSLFGYTYQIPFYIGLNRNAAVGAKYVYKENRQNLQVGFFKNSLYDTTRYAPDVIESVGGHYGDQENVKKNQGSIRYTYTFGRGHHKAEFGISANAGQLYNGKTDSNGYYWQGGAHLVGSYGRWILQLEGIRYAYHPHNPAGVSDDSILFGGGGPGKPDYLVAAKGTVLVSNIAYDLPIPIPQIQKLRFFDDYSRLFKHKSGWPDSQVNTIGVQIYALPVITWVGVAFGENMNFLGGIAGATGLASATSPGDNSWSTRVNINIGYYF